eukprot:GGOE01042558.1.p1 GENE.GGOE01042558.1~~GGOE01042558.1.p1  ORF type:complete len:206 (+),score=37.70 GGOE01042558.1:90-707(+)
MRWGILLVLVTLMLAGRTGCQSAASEPIYHLRQLLPSSDAPHNCLQLQGSRALVRRERCAASVPAQLFRYQSEASAFVSVREGLCLDAMYRNRRNRGLGTWPCHFEPNQQFPCQGARCCCAEEGLTDWCVQRVLVTDSAAANSTPAEPLPPALPSLPVPTGDGPTATRNDRHQHRPLVVLTVMAVLGLGLFGACFIMKTLLDEDF